VKSKIFAIAFANIFVQIEKKKKIYSFPISTKIKFILLFKFIRLFKYWIHFERLV